MSTQFKGLSSILNQKSSVDKSFSLFILPGKTHKMDDMLLTNVCFKIFGISLVENTMSVSRCLKNQKLSKIYIIESV